MRSVSRHVNVDSKLRFMHIYWTLDEDIFLTTLLFAHVFRHITHCFEKSDLSA